MTAGSTEGHLVLIVDPDLGFADSVSAMLEGHRVVTSRSMPEAAEIAAGGRVDLAIIGPSFGDEEGVGAASGLRSADPALSMVLVADVLTNRVLRAALRSGMADVIDAPVTQRKLSEAFCSLALIPDAELPAVDVVFEAAPPEQAPLEAPAPGPITAEAVVVPQIAHTVRDSGPETASVASATGIAFGEVFGVAPALPPDPAPLQVPIPDPIAVQEAVYAAPEQLEPPVRAPIEQARIPIETAAPAVPPVVETGAPQPPEPPAAEPPPVPAHEAVDSSPKPVRQPEPLAPAPIEQARMPVEVAAPAVPPTVEPVAPPAMPPGVEAAVPPAPEPLAMEVPPVLPIEVPPMPAGSPPLPGSAQTRVSLDAPSAFPPAMQAPEFSGSPLEVAAAALPMGLAALGAGEPGPHPIPGRRPGGGNVITVMSGKGGSGKSITATNLAAALAEKSGEDKVVIMDADLQFGDVALLLQVDPTRTIVDVADVIEDLTEPRLDGLLLRHGSGLRVLPAPLVPAAAERVSPKVIVRIMEMLRGMYAFVVVDTPPIFDDGLITLLEHSDDVLMVVDMDLPSVKNAKIALDTLRASQFDMNRLDVVVNRSNSKARLDLGELERSLGEEVAASIPSDRLIPQSVNEGIPAVAFSPRSKVAKAFHALARMYLPA